jgi:hypothetical protein
MLKLEEFATYIQTLDGFPALSLGMWTKMFPLSLERLHVFNCGFSADLLLNVFRR